MKPTKEQVGMATFALSRFVPRWGLTLTAPQLEELAKAALANCDAKDHEAVMVNVEIQIDNFESRFGKGCKDHWHCGPESHSCKFADRTKPCPSCGQVPELPTP